MAESQNQDKKRTLVFAIVILGLLIILLALINSLREEKQVNEETTKQNLTESSEGLEQPIEEWNNAKPEDNMVIGTWEVSEPDGYINGHGYVDLGLPSGTKWATCNVGATLPEEAGNVYAWGEIQPKDIDSDDICVTYKKNRKWLRTKGYVDSVGNLTPEHDAASKNWGDTWRMPTDDDYRELNDDYQYTNKAWGTYKGVDGCFIKSKINGKVIFFPAVGFDGLYYAYHPGKHGSYWTSSLNDGALTEIANIFQFAPDRISPSSMTARTEGLAVRAVSK